MDGDSRILYVPLENRVRELDARLIFSLAAVTANFQVVLGPKWLFAASLKSLPRGLYATKTLNKLDAQEMRMALDHGHTPIAWDEEGPGQIVPEVYLKGINDESVSLARRIFAWGKNQTRALTQKYPQSKSKIQTLGNPRWDLLRPEYRLYFKPEADALRAKFGRFILINTNFSSYNSALSDAAIKALAFGTGAFNKDDDSDQRLLHDIIDFERVNFEDYISFLPALSAAFPDHTIVIRPHPTENHQRWRDLVVPFPNIQTVYAGTVIPWLLAAEAVVQNSCTTGVEALTLERPVVSYCKNPSALHDLHLANEVCLRVRDEAELIECLRRFISDPSTYSEAHAAGRQALAEHISQLNGETSSAAIVKSLTFFANKCEKEGHRFDRKFDTSQGFRSYKINEYARIKLPPISIEDIAEKVSRLSKLRSDLAASISITHIHESCFYFRR